MCRVLCVPQGALYTREENQERKFLRYYEDWTQTTKPAWNGLDKNYGQGDKSAWANGDTGYYIIHIYRYTYMVHICDNIHISHSYTAPIEKASGINSYKLYYLMPVLTLWGRDICVYYQNRMLQYYLLNCIVPIPTIIQ